MIINVTNEIITLLRNRLTGVTVSASYNSSKPDYPLVIVSEGSNTSNIGTRDSSGEKYNDILLEINIYSNAKNKVTQVEGIRNAVDEILSDELGMPRTFSGVIPNVDGNVFRYVLRYAFLIDKNKKVYRR